MGENKKEAFRETTDILHHMGEHDLPFGAVSPPIFQSSIFSFKDFDAFQDALADEPSHFIYSRGNNPTVNLCEEKLAALEHGEAAKLVSSGVAAISTALFSCLKGEDHIIMVQDSYDWAQYIVRTYLSRYGIEHTFVEGKDIKDFEEAIRPNTRVIYLESPTSFTFKLQNLRQVASLAKTHGIKTIIDNTWATPLFQNPLDMGIDLVVHSATKYIGGNSDIVAGVIVGKRKEDIVHLFQTEFLPLGPTPDPFMAWLILRNLRTLHIRMPVHYDNALTIAKWLEGRDEVESVLYPMLSSYEQYELARKQMQGGSGLFSFRLKTRDVEKVKRFTNSLYYFKKAVSWGGYESLVFPAATHFKKGEPVPEDRVSLIRVHIGLEDKNTLIEDLEKAFKAIEE